MRVELKAVDFIQKYQLAYVNSISSSLHPFGCFAVPLENGLNAYKTCRVQMQMLAYDSKTQGQYLWL